MKNYKLQVSEGFKDTFGNEMLLKKEIENKVLNVFKLYGYELIKTPTVEYIDVYSSNGMQKPDLYSLINRQGEVLALCNDMTSAIVRFVSSNNINEPKKYCYIADTFRYPRLYQGKNHQFLQAGVEIIGIDSINSDVEALYLACKVLNKCNVNNFTVHLGSSEFLHVLLNDFNINDDIQAIIYKSIENKDYVTLKNILNSNLDSETAKFIIDLMLRGGKLKYIENLMNKLKDTKSYNVLVYLKNIYLTLNELGYKNILFDFSIYSYANYYTGMVFQIYIDNISKAIISGGRADNLFDSFGKSICDIGFGLDVDSLTTYILENDLINVKNEKYLSFASAESYIKANANNDLLREKGIIVNHVLFNTLADALEYAKANDYGKVIEYDNSDIRLWEVEKC